MDPINNLGNKVKTWASRVEGLAENVEKFVEANFKDQKDSNFKKFSTLIEKIVRDALRAPVKIKVMKLENFKGELPTYQTAHASGFDVRAQLDEPVELKPGERGLIPTGLSFEIPPGYEIQVRPRSGWAIRDGISLVNTPGTVDADYRGEVKVIVINHGQEPVRIEDQDRIAQLVVCPIVQAAFVEAGDLSETDRGDGGFGSTGK